MNYKHIKTRAYQILEKGEENDAWSKRIDTFIVWLIFINLTAVIVESVESIQLKYSLFFSILETTSVALFSVEYVLRIWSITENPDYESRFSGRIKYLFSFYSLVDLVSVVPAFFPLFIKVDTRFVRGIRLLRLFRILKLSRYNKAMGHIKSALRANKEELLISLSGVLILLVTASCLMYFIEHDDQPEAFSSIPATMWWGVATLTTVGYGDVYPVTDIGRFVAGIMAILGVGLFALPAGILANGFGKSMEDKKEVEHNETTPTSHTCDHCGKVSHK